jgi:hypothetical protein
MDTNDPNVLFLIEYILDLKNLLIVKEKGIPICTVLNSFPKSKELMENTAGAI